MGHGGRPWQVQSTYLDKREEKEKRKRQVRNEVTKAVLLLQGVVLQWDLNYYQS